MPVHSAWTHAVEKEPIQEIACALQQKTAIRIGDLVRKSQTAVTNTVAPVFMSEIENREKDVNNVNIFHWYSTSVYNSKMSLNKRHHCLFLHLKRINVD